MTYKSTVVNRYLYRLVNLVVTDTLTTTSKVPQNLSRYTVIRGVYTYECDSSLSSNIVKMIYMCDVSSERSFFRLHNDVKNEYITLIVSS